MPFTPDMRRKVDQIRDYLYGGGYPDPLSNAEQLSFLFFFYMIEGIDGANLRQAKATGRDYTSLFAGDWTLRNPLNAPTKGVETVPRERMRWSSWANAMSGEQLVTFVRDEVFPFFATIGDAFGMSFMAQARLAIDEPTVLTQIVTLVNELRLEQADPDTKGDLFEHVLRQIKQAGELGQFRTPRHIIRAIVDLVDPKIGETVYDPAAGTAGFLVAAYEHIRLANSSANGRDVAELEGKTFERGYGDRLNAAQWRKLQTATFYGNDVDPKMVSLASMNLALRGLPDVRILKRNVLTTSFDRQAKAEKGLPLDGYDVVLANPPFSGRLDRDRIVDDVRIGTSHGDRTAVRQIHDRQSQARRPLRRGRAGGRAVRLHRRAQGTAAHPDAEQPGRGGAVAARRGVPALFGGEDLGAGVRQGRAHGTGDVPARQQ